MSAPTNNITYSIKLSNVPVTYGSTVQYMHAKHSLSSIAHNTHTMHKQSILFKVLLGHTAQFCITLATSSFHIPKAYMDIQP